MNRIHHQTYLWLVFLGHLDMSSHSLLTLPQTPAPARLRKTRSREAARSAGHPSIHRNCYHTHTKLGAVIRCALPTRLGHVEFMNDALFPSLLLEHLHRPCRGPGGGSFIRLRNPILRILLADDISHVACAMVALSHSRSRRKYEGAKKYYIKNLRRKQENGTRPMLQIPEYL